MSQAPLEARLLRAGLFDPFIEGNLRVSESPVTLSKAEWRDARNAGERIAFAYDELVRVVSEDPDLLDSFFALTPTQRVMWQLSAPFWHVFGRVDLFRTKGGWKTTEMNCDTPTGQVEATALARVAGVPTTHDPNRDLEGAFVRTVLATAQRTLGREPRSVGLIFPTDQTEDLALIHLYRSWFARVGLRVAMGSPYNLTTGPGGEVRVLGQACDVVLRHYKTDWWGERVSAFSDDEPFADPLPLTRELLVLAEAEERRVCVVVNPFASVVPQNKRAMALMWEEIHRFSPEARSAIEEHVPYTVRFESMHPGQVLAERERWVLKSDYGCEGDEVCVGAEVTDAVWNDLVLRLAPGRWIVQERFEAVRNEHGEIENLGVYVFGGEAHGVYARTSRGATDRYARSAAVRAEAPTTREVASA